MMVGVVVEWGENRAPSPGHEEESETMRSLYPQLPSISLTDQPLIIRSEFADVRLFPATRN